MAFAFEKLQCLSKSALFEAIRSHLHANHDIEEIAGVIKGLENRKIER